MSTSAALTVRSASRINHAGPVRVWPALRIHECFEILADRQPAAPAIISDRGAITYAELDQKANALAHALLAHGVMTEESVGVLAERSGSLPLAFLATLKAGGAYVPMGADLPPQRLANMATQSRMRRLIALDGLEPPAELLAALSGNAAGMSPAIFRPEDVNSDGHRPNKPGKTSDLLAILFTSGSTGQPKGVLIQHDACVNMAYGHISALDISPDDRLQLAAAPGFIMGFRELCLPVLSGAAFVPATRALLDDPAGLLAAMSRHRVTVAMFTPSYLRLFHGAVPASLRCLLTAGERPNAGDARAYARKLDYWNIYGATEVCGTIGMSRVHPNGDGPLPGGRPFTNMSVHLLGRDGQEVPPGEVGEIHVMGIGVARGYLNQPGLTAERFVETPYGRAYRSGDLGRWNEDGNLEPLGRANDLVKVSGQAVSLGEIEQTLLRHETVRHAVAMQHEGKLIAFVESDQADRTSFEDWHRLLAQTLPAYMLPAQVTALSKMPLNFYGKVDRQALLALAVQASQSRNGAERGALPHGDVERHIAEVWEEILGVRPIMREDNFYALGGTSLQSIAISQRLHTLGYAVSAQTILVARTVAALGEKIALTSELTPVPRSSEPHQDVATAGQEDFWIAWKLGFASTGSQVTRVLAVLGTAPKPARWQEAWTRLVARHAALRTAFVADAGEKVLWRTVEAKDLVPAVQISIDRCDSLNNAWERITVRSSASFLLTEPPLARAGLVQMAEGETVFWFTLHHSVADGFSARIVQEEMHALLLERPLPVAPNGVAQASQAERHYLSSDLAERDRTWWRDKLDSLSAEAGGEAFNEFTTDHLRPASPSGKPAAAMVERLDAAAVAALTRLAQAQEVGLHALLLTLLGAEARRRDGRRSVIIGSGISIRPPGADRAVGHFVNLLPLILTGGNAPTLATQIRATQTTLTEAVEHGSYPASLLYREFRQRHPHARAQARTSLFDISLTTNPSRTCGDSGADFAMTPACLPGELGYPAAGLDLDFSHAPVEDNGGGLELTLAWNPDVYNRNTAQAWLSSFAAWARWLAEDTSRADAPLPALLPEDAQCLARWERGPVRTRPAKRFHELFESLADGHPQRPAVVTETGVETYAELECRANSIAQTLLDHSVSREEPVAVLTECSADLPATVLGIWKAGAVYLPLALEQPGERLAFMARDSGAKILMVLDGHAVPQPLAQAVKTILRPDACAGNAERPNIAGTPQDLAYIIYTSGTTGMPKGVLIQHDSLVNAGLMTGEAVGLTPEDRFSLAATPGFDASLWELGGALLHGMALVPVSRTLRDDPWALKQQYKKHGVTVAFHAPSWLRVSKQTPFEGMRILITGGEAPNHDDARYYANHLALWNGYGPTETCIFVCAERLSPHPDTSRPLSVGRPLANTRVSIRRDNGDPAPPGVLGEVWLSGAGLARGYLNNPELTAQRFVETPDGRFYRSGDLGRWTEDGRLELSGRIDFQIKLHGQRVELGEIEQALVSHPAVEEAVTLAEASANDTKALRAFVRLRPGAVMPAQDEWRGYLGDRLPQYMVSASVTSVAAIPLTFTGKIDRDALLLSGRRRSDGAVKSPPSGEMETRIAALWSDLLGQAVSREDNFFALGGNSLLAVTIAHRLSCELARPVPARELFTAPTLAAFAQRMAELMRTALSTNDTQAAAPARSDLATEGQREFWVAEAAGLDTRTFIIPVMRIVDGGMPPRDRWNKAWARVVARHEALRTWFHEDAEGRLHRAVVPALVPTLETATQPDRSAARAFIRQRQGEPFVMGALPLWRAGLVHVADSGEDVFWLALHHSVGDGRSIGIITEEFSALLRGEQLPPLACNFAEFAAREESSLAGPACAGDARYWRDLLTRQPDRAFDEGPLDFPRSSTAKTGNHRFETRLDAATTKGLKALAQQHEASLHAVMVTLLALEARRRMGREDVVIGMTADTRETAAEMRVIGYYVNMLPLVCHVPRDAGFGAVLSEAQQALALGLQHSRYPFARMYRDFWSERPEQRHPARYPLFDLAVSENPGIPFSGSTPVAGNATRYDLRLNAPAQDMVLVHESQPDGRLVLHWFANAAIYEKETAEAWIDSLAGWARFLAEGKRRPSSPLPALLPEEEYVLAGWERGSILPHPSPSLPARFEHWARIQPERPALINEQQAQSYAELNARSNALAHALVQQGVKRQEVVGVLTERSIALPETVLSIWKAGGCYLPLVMDLPADRLAFIARDAGIRVLVVLDGLEPPAALAETGCKIFRPGSFSEAFLRSHGHPLDIAGDVAGASDPACILYTSGSTGMPKGVMLHHEGLNNLGVAGNAMLDIRSGDRTLLMASPSFDAWIADLAMAWTAGAAVVPVLRSEMEDIAGMRDKMARLRVSTATMTPSYLRLFEQADFPGLRLLTTVGEPPYRADALHYATRLRYFNGYGPTENTAAVSFGQIAAHAKRLTAGKPLANTSVYIRDSRGEPLPPGAVGLIWLGGMGLALGYLNRPDLTAASFVETPAGRLYCTGDLGRWTHTGELEILGRSDGQVKLRGQRVELGEIEHRLGAYPGVRQGVALVEAQTLWAFVALHTGVAEPTQAAWHDYLSSALPAYMLPSAVLRVPAIPMNTSGKVDRAALLRVVSEWGTNVAEAERTQPREGTERRVAEVWAEHLECRFIGRQDNFFDLGGDSLRAIAVVNQLRRTFHCTVNDLYEHPRLADFAGVCQPQPEHLRMLLRSTARHWQSYRDGFAAYEAERDAALTAVMRDYETRNQSYRLDGAGERRDYGSVLLTGATGYLGSYVLRELLTDGDRQVSVLVRGGDDLSARARVGKTLCHYFGQENGAALRDHPRLTVLAGDLRRDGLGLTPQAHDRLADSLQAIFHCAANVKHFGHYWEFHADNVAATSRLLKLAGHSAANPADFHLVSTLSTCGKTSEAGFRLFTEYDTVPEVLDENYYIRSKQEAERLVVASRRELANACIHRVGNLVFAAEGGPLQFNIRENAFFRQLAAFIRLGVVPDDSHLWLCHVDLVARGLVLLAGAADLTNETHHLENARRDTLATFVTAAEGVRACGFEAFLERLEEAVDEPEMGAALAESLENFELYRGLAPQERARRLEIVCGRTQTLLARLGLVWPPVPMAGQAEMLRQAARHFSRPSLSKANAATGGAM